MGVSPMEEYPGNLTILFQNTLPATALKLALVITGLVKMSNGNI